MGEGGPNILGVHISLDRDSLGFNIHKGEAEATSFKFVTCLETYPLLCESQLDHAIYISSVDILWDKPFPQYRYGGPGGHVSRQWLSRITPVSSPPTIVTSPPSVTLISVQFSLRTVAIPVYMLITRPCTSPSQGCGYRRSPPHPHGSVGYDTRIARRSRV